MVWVMRRTQRPGHWWGDDWALYIRQAQALLDGRTQQVATENAFTISQSLGPAFSPPLYPWGFPMLLVPAVAVYGIDLDRLAVVEMVCSCVVAIAWYALARRRLGTLVALVGMVAVTMSPLLLSWTELIQSELPFVAAAFSALVAIDAAAARGVFDPDRATWTRSSWWWLVLIGFGAAAAFTIRREGLALIPAIAAAQFVALTGTTEIPASRQFMRSAREWTRSTVATTRAAIGASLPPAGERGRFAFRLALPHLVAATLVIGLQLVMPSTVVPRYRGTSILNIWSYRRRIAANLAEISGFKRAWETQPEVLSSAILGWIVVVIYLCLGVIGVTLGLTLWRRRDAHLAVYTIGAFVIGGSFRSAVNRYVASVGPLLLLFGLCVVAWLVGRPSRRWASVAVPALIAAAIVAGNLANAHVRAELADAYADADAVEWGPTHPDSVAMFNAVRSLSRPGDVVAAPKARSMVLETGRESIQVDEYRPIPSRVDIDLLVVEQGTELLATVVRDDDYQQVWANSRFVIFRPQQSAGQSEGQSEGRSDDQADRRVDDRSDGE